MPNMMQQQMGPGEAVDTERKPWWQVSPISSVAVEGTNRCLWCRNIFDRPRRPLAQVELLRKTLKVDMTTPYDPPICDGCYEHVVGSALVDEKVEKPGSANNGHANLVLRINP